MVLVVEITGVIFYKGSDEDTYATEEESNDTTGHRTKNETTTSSDKPTSFSKFRWSKMMVMKIGSREPTPMKMLNM